MVTDFLWQMAGLLVSTRHLITTDQLIERDSSETNNFLVGLYSGHWPGRDQQQCWITSWAVKILFPIGILLYVLGLHLSLVLKYCILILV